MTETPKPFTGNTPIGAALAHPEGGPLLREMLAQGGVDESVLNPVRQIPLQELVTISRGAFQQAVLDDLILRANGGVLPDETADESGWRERITPGRFAHKTIIVTGAASGIGRATASRILREGGRVIAVDLASDGLDALAAELPDAELTTVTANITQTAEIERIVASAGSRVDGLANVAGIADDFSAIHEVSDEMWQRMFAVNVDGSFRLMRAVIPGMLEAGRGSVVNVASEAWLRGNAAGVAYTASKHAVVGMTRSSAFMYGPHGIRVNAVAPGGVLTGISPGAASEFGQERIQTFLPLAPPVAMAAHLAASITFLLSDDGVNVNGAVLPSDGGWSVQ